MTHLRFILVATLLSAACGQTRDSGMVGPLDAARDDGRPTDTAWDGPRGGDMAGPGDDGVSDASGEPDPDMGEPPPGGPTRYLAGPLRSPITGSVVDSMREIRRQGPARDEAVFMKAGASGTVNRANLTCFGPTSSYRVELDGRGELQPVIDRFAAVTFGSQASWDRTTLAAEIGRTAAWVQTGAPSPLDQEIAALNPAFAIVNYGTNDMQQGITHATALWPFYDNMVRLLEGLRAGGIVPIVIGLNPRGDTTEARRWVPTYDAATRALAESLQVPFIDLYLAVKDLADQGLISDGIHGNSYPSGGDQPCVFTPAGLAYNYNARNLLTLQALDVIAATVVDGAAAPDVNPRAWAGSGTPADPVMIDVLPFSHHADTALSTVSQRAGYPDCDSGQDESGPEVYYTLELAAPTPVRLLAFDADGVDVDIHLLDGESCLRRHDRMIQGTFGPGTYTVVVDTWVSAGTPRAGKYTLVTLECETGDPDCN